MVIENGFWGFLLCKFKSLCFFIIFKTDLSIYLFFFVSVTCHFLLFLLFHLHFTQSKFKKVNIWTIFFIQSFCINISFSYITTLALPDYST